MFPADDLPNLDDHSGRSLPADLLWTWRNLLPRRRKRQGLLVFALMLLGGFAELMTLGAVVPLLALLASNGASPSSNRCHPIFLFEPTTLAVVSSTPSSPMFRPHRIC